MSRLASLSGPIKLGLIAASIAVLLVIVGVIKGAVPANPLSIVLALLISASSWFLVVWAIATAASDVEKDLVDAAEDADPTFESSSASK